MGDSANMYLHFLAQESLGLAAMNHPDTFVCPNRHTQGEACTLAYASWSEMLSEDWAKAVWPRQ